MEKKKIDDKEKVQHSSVTQKREKELIKKISLLK